MLTLNRIIAALVLAALGPSLAHARGIAGNRFFVKFVSMVDKISESALRRDLVRRRSTSSSILRAEAKRIIDARFGPHSL